MKAALSVLALIVLLVSTIATAHTDGIYNSSGNSVGDTQGIDSAVATGTGASGKILLVDAVSFLLQTDAASKVCRAGGC